MGTALWETRLLTAATLFIAWLMLVWTTWLRPARQHRAARSQPTQTASSQRIAVIHASQSGTAAELAQRTVQALGTHAYACPLADFTPQTLGHLRTALFIVSTYGEGDPPDSAHAFERHARTWPASTHLDRLRFALLALGDRRYANFCAYGQKLARWLRQNGATPLFDTLWVDRLDQTALEQWQTRLSAHLQAQPWQASTAKRWRLLQRRCLNPGSQGAACHELLLQCHAPELPIWQAGDIAQIHIGDSGQQRDYSIASTPNEGHIRLLIRMQYHADGAPGLGSHWLSKQLATGDALRLHIRSNPQFHLADKNHPAIFIGNGTGLAGLRALIQARRARDQGHNWLLFGERQRQYDFFWQDVLQAWLADGTLSRLDLAFSRDQPEKRYVHHCLRASATLLKDWIARGAVLYVCGNRSGMAHDVDLALQDILGRHGYQDLIAHNRYRRDVY